ncbi:MAG: aminoacyl-tRNA hydrolase [Alphaproteobacteria bacterium]|nr:aminoacyl-tRNA hydrolase [Alphaproteobacteria bacterium]
MSAEFLLIGLGNPEPQYRRNRHNAGFMAIDAIADAWGFGAEQEKYHGLLSKGVVEGKACLALKPMTYMNLSGKSVQPVAAFFKIPPQRMIVLHDELDVPFGKVKVKRGGGSGGHNGIKSIDEAVGQDYIRVRIGIGHPGDKDRVTGHVLGNYTTDEEAQMKPVFDKVADALPWLLADDMPKFLQEMA